MSATPRAILAGGTAAAAVVAALASPAAFAHGVWGHVHVTGWSIEGLPPGDLRDFFDDAEVTNAALYGAAYTDSGYFPQGGPLAAAAHAYGEHTHWEPFVEDFVQWILANDPPPWESLESRKRVAFLLGCGAHGLQDEVFDSIFLYRVAEEDGGGQDVADPGTDGFLALDGHLRFLPERWIPMETVLELYEVLDAGVTEEVIEDATDLQLTFYLNEGGYEVAEELGLAHGPDLLWTRDHYMDPHVPGSLASEVPATAAYLQSIWDRLHGGLAPDGLVVHTYPSPPGRLLGVDPASAASWVTLVTGKGIVAGTATASWQDAAGADVPFSFAGTRWGGLAADSRVVRFQPAEALSPGAFYTLGIAAGATLIDDTTSTAPFSLTFQAACDEATADLCVDPEPAPLPQPEPEDVPAPAPEPEPAAEPAPAPAVADEEPSSPPSKSDGCAGSPAGALPFFALAALAFASARRRLRVARRPGRGALPRRSRGSFRRST